MTMAPPLPGFYFDEEKKKYFKIQPNHIAPSNAKYAQSNVTHEQHIAKKQKVENDHKKKLQQQTVVPASILKHSLLGGGLLHEHGFQSRAATLRQREDAFLRGLQLKPNSLRLPVSVVWDAHWVGTSRMVVTTANELVSCDVQTADVKLEVKPHSAIRHFYTPVNRIVSTCTSVISDEPYVLVCTDGDGSHACFVRMSEPHRASLIWGMNDTLVDCAMNQNAILAFAGEHTISTFDTFGQKISSLNLSSRTSSLAIEWLGENTLAYGTCESRKKEPSVHKVMLWDVRSRNATAARFTRPKRVTGISRPDTSGNNLIVSSNYDLSLYDLRVVKEDRPILTIPHLSVGPVTYHSTHNGSMMAAVDDRQAIQAYSWRTGKHVKTILEGNEDWQPFIMRNVKWVDRMGRLELQACAWDKVLTFEME